jgi:hypothetical protein
MKKELKERWITALRSGDYGQSQGCLQDKYGWCCLGVLCNIVDGTKWIEPAENVMEHEYDFGNEVVLEDMPPREWLENHGLPHGLAKELAGLNDDGVQFVEIAEYIKENVNEND